MRRVPQIQAPSASDTEGDAGDILTEGSVKPNYISIMNYDYELHTLFPAAGWPTQVVVQQ